MVNEFLEKIFIVDNFPEVPLIHGFCLGIKKKVIEEIGYFDIHNFKKYYGEENDYCLRSDLAGFKSLIISNTFVFHNKSKSIPRKERIIHMQKSKEKLREIYGVENIKTKCLQGENHPLLNEIRDKVKIFFNKNGN